MAHRYDYLPFGEGLSAGVNGRSALFSAYNGGAFPAGGDGETVKFTGQERDPETGFDHFPARHMSPVQARFLSPDPVGNFVADMRNPQSWNLYSYVFNNPLAYFDPTGTCSVKEGDDVATDDPDEPCGTTITVSGGEPDPIEPWYSPIGDTLASSGADSGEPTPTFSVTTWLRQQLVVRTKGQTFGQCMAQHANNFSLAGAFDSIAGTELRNTLVGGALRGNDFLSLAYGTGGDAAIVGATKAPYAAVRAMKSPLSYGRRTTEILPLNLPPAGVRAPGGVPLALGDASIAAKTTLRLADKVLGAFTLTVEAKLAIDATLAAVEAGVCAGTR